MTLFYISLEHPKALAYTQVDLRLLFSSRRVHTLLLRCLGELSLMMSGAACGSSHRCRQSVQCDTQANLCSICAQLRPAPSCTSRDHSTTLNAGQHHETGATFNQRRKIPKETESIWHYCKHHCGIKVTFSNNPVNSG